MISPFLTMVVGVATLPLTVTWPVSMACFCQQILAEALEDIGEKEDKETNVILRRPVPELGGEDLEQLPTPPSFLAVGVVGVVVGPDAAQAALEVVGCRPGVAGRHDDVWRRFGRGIWGRDLDGRVDGRERHGDAATAGQVGGDARGECQG